VSIELLNESGMEVDEVTLVELARHVLDGMRVHPLAELSMVLVDEEAMTRLNEQWMGERGPTDVLAFPMDELRPGHHAPGDDDEDAEPDPALLGDVVLCPQVAAVQARKARHSVEDELHLLGTHGILHLLGYDHAAPDEHEEMFGLQAGLLDSWRSRTEDPAAGRAAPGTDAGAAGTESPGTDGSAARGSGAKSPPAKRSEARESSAKQGSTAKGARAGAPSARKSGPRESGARESGAKGSSAKGPGGEGPGGEGPGGEGPGGEGPEAPPRTGGTETGGTDTGRRS
jgi:probable rRNA maturation factor